MEFLIRLLKLEWVRLSHAQLAVGWLAVAAGGSVGVLLAEGADIPWWARPAALGIVLVCIGMSVANWREMGEG